VAYSLVDTLSPATKAAPRPSS